MKLEKQIQDMLSDFTGSEIERKALEARFKDACVKNSHLYDGHESVEKNLAILTEYFIIDGLDSYADELALAVVITEGDFKPCTD